MMIQSRPGKREIAARILDASGMRRVVSGVGPWSGLQVLNYHRIGVPSSPLADHGVYSATQEEFAAQLAFLSREFDVIRLDQVNDILTGKRKRGVLLTFDDGYRDNYELAFPVLKEYGLSAVFFLTTGFLDNGTLAWWDELAWTVRTSPLPTIPENRWTGAAIAFDEPNRERAIRRLLGIHKQLPWKETPAFRQELRELLKVELPTSDQLADVWMTWDMVREMHAGGMEFGGHTVTHPVLANLPVAEQREEIVQSKQRIETEIGSPIQAFSYPVGQHDSFTAETEELLKEVGYRFGFSFMAGIGKAHTADWLSLPRYSIELGTPESMFRTAVTLPQLFGR
ncbi:MAG: polysaccharide deacetylase family protein [Planctomycetaceae bacterium]